MSGDRRSSSNFGHRRRRDDRPKDTTPKPDPVQTQDKSEEKKLSEPPEYLWKYRWEDPLNGFVAELAEPRLVDRLIADLARFGASARPDPLIFIRGELGVGKSTLAVLLVEEAAKQRQRYKAPAESSSLQLLEMIEAGDLESPESFALRVNQAARETHPTVALARPGTFDMAANSINKTPDITVTMLPFKAGSLMQRTCIETVCKNRGVANEVGSAVERICRDLPEFVQTPFYYGEVANALSKQVEEGALANRTALEMLEVALDVRLGIGAFSTLLHMALERNAWLPKPVQGITDQRGFIHDGYRNVVLAVGVLNEKVSLIELLTTKNSVPAFRLLLDHAASQGSRGPNDRRHDELVKSLSDFARSNAAYNTVPYVIYLRALAAVNVDAIEGPADRSAIVRQCCLDLIRDLEASTTGLGNDTGTLAAMQSQYIWMDVSDALSLVGDPRLPSGSQPNANDPGYYTSVPRTNLLIGSNGTVTRHDMAKPLIPYASQEVTVGPFWVANFLVTTDQFAEFWRDSDRDDYFNATGAQWIRREDRLLAGIAKAFDASAERNFWKELREQRPLRNLQFAHGSKSVLAVARERALGDHSVKLWDPAQADDRFTAPGKPVVGVNWWESMAFAAWYQDNRLVGFPPNVTVSLLSDWEWEAVRRLYYLDSATPIARTMVNSRTFPAHLRRVELALGARERNRAHRSSSLQTLHVGLFPTPSGLGPRDMVGNVWEWTRSRVYGRIVESTEVDPVFGRTIWDDGDIELESIAVTDDRDVIDTVDDLAYRAVRGASFFSVDPGAAWHPAYRLCDPPFASYFDLGFRLAVYPQGVQS